MEYKQQNIYLNRQREIINSFVEMLQECNDIKVLNRIKNMFNNLELLDQEKIAILIENLEFITYNLTKEKGNVNCKDHKHNFGEWQKGEPKLSYTAIPILGEGLSELMLRHPDKICIINDVPYFKGETENYKRVCSICNKEEIAYEKPKELEGRTK